MTKTLDSGVERDMTPEEEAELAARQAAPLTPPVPEDVAMWQARAVMIEEGLLDTVLAVLAAIPDEQARKLAQAKFEYSNTVRRDDPLVTLVIPALGKSEADIDAMFFRAKALT